MSQGSIISLGSVNADFQVRVDRRPDLSETLLANDFLQHLLDRGVKNACVNPQRVFLRLPKHQHSSKLTHKNHVHECIAHKA
ncbi:MAG: hypothetical protein V7L20_14135 [Nostoc sp.]|uniref:hypothetical protein n=1 Tax=Nostoc sp. TaxID=1180 RepID=UPI002FF8C768